MGTSNSNPGPGGDTPLIPTWLGSGGDGPAAQPPPEAPGPEDAGDGEEPAPPPPVPKPPPERPPLQAGDPRRFTAARNSLTRFARSGGSNGRNLRRAISNYVSTSSGGPRQAASRMGASRSAAAGLLDFLSDARSRGGAAALREVNLGALAGQPLEEIFLALADVVCPENGTVDEGVARDAFIEMIADLAKLEITDLDQLTVDQVQTMLELYATHAIEGRLCNDIGMKLIRVPKDLRAARQVEKALRDFVRRAVSDSIEKASSSLGNLSRGEARRIVDRVYKDAFEILSKMADEEEEES